MLVSICAPHRGGHKSYAAPALTQSSQPALQRASFPMALTKAPGFTLISSTLNPKPVTVTREWIYDYGPGLNYVPIPGTKSEVSPIQTIGNGGGAENGEGSFPAENQCSVSKMEKWVPSR